MLALGLRLGAGIWWQERLPAEQRFFFPDSESYWSLGRALARGEPYVYGAEEAHIFRTPGYPVLLAPIFLIAGDDPSPYFARVLSAVLGTCTVAVIMGFTQSLFNAPAARIAGLLAACEPGTISQGVFALSEAPFCPLMLLHLWAWWLAIQATEDSRSYTHAAWGGAMAALATLMRPSWLLFLPFAGGLLCLAAQPRKRHTAILACMTLTFALTMSPWWIRNYQLTGRFIPTTLQVGASLYDGLNPQADGSSEMSFVPRFIAAQQAEDAQASTAPRNTFEERLDARLGAAALEWMKANPGRALQLAGIKFIRLWTPWPHARDIGGNGAKFIMALGYLPILITGLLGARYYLRRNSALVILVLPALYFTLLHCVFVSSLRYRQPALLPFIMLGSAYLWEKMNAQTTRRHAQHSRK
jgi:4-amino-4-deoxy-L-arabinose transferase-like glycosyltransferase